MAFLFDSNRDNMKIIQSHFLFFIFLFLYLNGYPVEPFDNMQIHHKKKASVELITVYRGTLPCADCPGIVTEILFDSHNVTYREKDVYLERNVEKNSSGSYNTERGYKKDRNAVVFVLDDDQPEKERRFLKLNDTTLLMLDGEGEVIDTTSSFKLYKIKKSN
jgi:copper homeostasis protein (lipoprotein)